jgi:branched-chain amino acid transport system substrate-binding protein
MKKTTRWSLLFGVLAVSAFGLVACGDDDDDDDDGGSGGAVAGFTEAGYKAAGFKTFTVEAGQPIKLGISSALTGDAKGLGVPIADSAKAAAEGVTIKGHKIEFVSEDDLCTPEGGPAAADRLVKANVVAVIGPICSGGTRPSLPIYDKAGIVHISPSASAGDLSAPARPEGPYPTFLRLPVLNGDEAQAQAVFIKDTLKIDSAFVVFDTDDYGKDLSTQFQKFFKEKGGKIVGTPTGYEKKQSDFKAVIASIKQAKPGVVYVAGFYTEATALLQQLRADNDTKSIVFMGSDGVKNDELLKGAKEAAEGTYHAVPGAPGSEFAKYAKAYAAFTKGKESDAEGATFGGEAYDAATAIIKAIEAVGVDNGGKLTIDGRKLQEAILKSNFAGASGQVKFKPNGDRDGAVVQIFKVVGGKYVVLKAGEK